MSQAASAFPARADGLPTVTVVIPALNEAAILEKCLGALCACPRPAEEILVVDNGSTDGTAEIARSFEGVRVLTESRPGITFARRSGFDAARGDVIARIDADSIVSPWWIDELRAVFGSRPEVDGVAGGAAIVELSPPGRFWGRWWYRGFRAWHERSIGVSPMLYGFNSAFRREAWLDSRHLTALGDLHVSDDVDVTIALLRTGKRLVFAPKLVVNARLFRSVDSEKLKRYYRSDGLTLARHGYGNPKRWIVERGSDDFPFPAESARAD